MGYYRLPFPILITLGFFFFFFRENFITYGLHFWCLLFYYQTKTPIGFLNKWNLNSKSLLIKLTKTHCKVVIYNYFMLALIPCQIWL